MRQTHNAGNSSEAFRNVATGTVDDFNLRDFGLGRGAEASTECDAAELRLDVHAGSDVGDYLQELTYLQADRNRAVIDAMISQGALRSRRETKGGGSGRRAG
jgi:hypothetical protein